MTIATTPGRCAGFDKIVKNAIDALAHAHDSSSPSVLSLREFANAG
jgi:hypothetical protein